jgi:hypothetical protein
MNAAAEPGRVAPPCQGGGPEDYDRAGPGAIRDIKARARRAHEAMKRACTGPGDGPGRTCLAARALPR